MVKMFNLLFLLAIALFLTSCNNDDNVNEKHVKATSFLPTFNEVLKPDLSGGYDQQLGITESKWNDHFEEMGFYEANGVVFSKVSINDEEFVVVEGSAVDVVFDKISELLESDFITTQTMFSFFGIKLTDDELTLLNLLGNDEITDEQLSAIEVLEERLKRSAANKYDFQTNLDFPTTVNELPITTIADDAFDALYVSKVSNIETVNFNRMTYLEKIGFAAFRANEIKYVNIEGLEYLTTIYMHAFNNNQIKEVTLVNLENLMNIDTGTFMNNEIKNVTLKNLDAMDSIGLNAFANNRITDVSFTNLSNGEGVADFTMANNAFDGNMVQNLTLDRVGFGVGAQAVSMVVQRILTNALTTVTTLNTSQWMTVAQFNAIYDLTPGINFVFE